MADKKDTYIVHNADISCNLGLRMSKLVLRQSHGVFLKEQAQVTAKDCVGKTNIIDFCGCISADNPLTQKKAHEISDKVKSNTGEDFDSEVEDIFCNGTVGSVKTMSCAGECIPDIVSSGWDEVKDNVFTDGQNPVRGIATLKCRWGGVITIELTGQPEG